MINKSVAVLSRYLTGNDLQALSKAESYKKSTENNTTSSPVAEFKIIKLSHFKN